MFRKKINTVFLIGILSILTACKWNNQLVENNYQVVCTTSIIGDVVRTLLPEEIEVITLMGPGVDPHLYEAKPSDVRKMSEAHVVIYNGLHLEGKLAKLFQRMEKEKQFIRFSDGMDEHGLIALNAQTHDPHVWFDVLLWLQGVTHVKDQLIKIYPVYQKEISSRFLAYEQELVQMNEYVTKMMESIPKSQRLLITSHDAFHYFGKAYKVEVQAIQGVSTLMEPGLKDVSSLVQTITNRKIPALFVESSVSSKSIKSVIEVCHFRKWPVKIGGTLFSDALGSKNENADTYIKMIKKNCETIYKALTDEF